MLLFLFCRPLHYEPSVESLNDNNARAPAAILGGSRLDMHRQMDILRREMGMESQQWEVEGMIGKGAHGVVYKVSKEGEMEIPLQDMQLLLASSFLLLFATGNLARHASCHQA